MTAGSAAARAVPAEDEAARRQAELDESLTRFIQENHKLIERFLRRLCADRALVEDALQEALITTCAKWEIVSQHDQPLFWVRKTAWHKLMALQESGRGTVRLDDVLPEALVEPTNPWEAQLMVQYLLRRLPARQAAVLALAADGNTDEEICLQLDLALTTVRSYKAAARRKLKELAEQAEYAAATRRRS